MQNERNRIVTELIFMANGTKGDIYPLLGLARKLKENGYGATFLANDVFKVCIEGEGIAFHSLGDIESYNDLHENERVWDANEDFLEIAFEHTLKPAMKRAFDFVNNAYIRNKNIGVISFSPLMNGALVAARNLKVPNILITLSPRSISSYYPPHEPLPPLLGSTIMWKLLPPPIKARLSKHLEKKWTKNILRKTHYFKEYNRVLKKMGDKGVSSFTDRLYEGIDLHICFFPSWYSGYPRDWPDEVEMVGFSLYSENNFEARVTFDQFVKENGPPILFTAGTGVYDKDEIFSVGMEVCKKLGVSGLMVGGGKVNPLIQEQGSFLHLPYIDFGYSLSKCLAIVHHGGIGTIAQAIRAGIPQLIRPMAFDQPDNAQRIYRLGLGTFCYPKYFHAELVANYLKYYIDSASRNRRLKMLSADVARSDAYQEAIELIESLFENFKKIS